MAAWTDEESTRLTELHAAGKSLSFIATDMQRSKETISRHSDRLGLSFDRGVTAKAAEAVHVDNKARRVLLEERLLVEAQKIMDQLWEPTLVFSFGGKDNDYNEHIIDRPTFSDQKAIVQTATTAIRESTRLHEMNAGSNADHSKAMLVKMQAALLELHTEEDEDSSGDPR
ncbi:helix-turn-helix domain-containing protein [Rhodococcus qingshengii]|uniref:helix-turn-helix domain-containing protein n=1 Tax=Rhodococcus qingshengii TaxID=334542 RepID=UPI00269D75FF